MFWRDMLSRGGYVSADPLNEKIHSKCMYSMLCCEFYNDNSGKKYDEGGIRTHACRAQWISNPSP